MSSHTHKWKVTPGVNGATTYGYDTRGRLTGRTDAEGGLVSFAYPTLPYNQVDDRVSSVSVTRGPGDVLWTYFAYNARNQVTYTWHPDGSSTLNGYDGNGNRTSFRDELGHTWTTQYDQLRRKTSETDPLGRVTVYEYDLISPGVSGANPNVTSIQLPSGKITKFTYNLNFQKTSETAGYGTADMAMTSYAYNTNDGTLTSVTDPRGKVTSFTYDGDKRRATQTDALGLITSWTYDGAGNTLTVQRPATGSTGLTSNAYDEMNRLISTTDPAGQTTAYTYGRMAPNDGGDTLQMMVDAAEKAYTFENDKLGRRTKMIYPPAAVGESSPQESWMFDGAGNVKTFTNRAGAVRTNFYDSRNRETSWSMPDGFSASTGYDAAGRVTSQANMVSSSAYAYNNANELLSEMQDIGLIPVGSGSFNPAARTVSYTYNTDGNRWTMTYPDGTALTYAYTGRNQLDTITSSGVVIVNYDYDPAGNRTSRTVPGSGVSTTSVDDIGRVTYTGFSGAWTAYEYDNAGNVTWRYNGGADADKFEYTADDQLDVVRYGVNGESQNRRVNYDHDPVGNRTAVATTVSGATTTDTYMPSDGLNRYTNIQMPDGQRTLSYDGGGNLSNGNLTRVDSLEGTRTFSYDALNRLTGTTQMRYLSGSSGPTETQDVQVYYYDARNRCVARVVQTYAEGQMLGATLTTYTYDGWNVIETFSGYSSPAQPLGSQSAEYVHGANVDEIVRAQTGVGGVVTTYHHHDALGSVIALTDATGAVVERYMYDVFGQPAFINALPTQESAYGNKFLFTGREWVPLAGGNQVGLYDYRNRAYTALLGRFMQTDPIRFDAGDANLYRYVGNRVTGARDPSGLRLKISGDGITDHEATKLFMEAENYLRGTAMGNLILKMRKLDFDFKIRVVKNNTNDPTGNCSYHRYGKVTWDPTYGLKYKNGGVSPAVALGHEMAHQWHYYRTRDYDELVKQGKEEQRVIDDYETPTVEFLNKHGIGTDKSRKKHSEGEGVHVNGPTVVPLP